MKRCVALISCFLAIAIVSCSKTPPAGEQVADTQNTDGGEAAASTNGTGTPWGEPGDFPYRVVKLTQQIQGLRELWKSKKDNETAFQIVANEKILQALLEEQKGETVSAKLSVLSVSPKEVRLTPDVTWGWPTQTIAEMSLAKENDNDGIWHSAVRLTRNGAASLHSPLILKVGDDISSDAAKPLTWNDKLLVTFKVDDVVITTAKRNRIASSKPLGGPTTCQVQISDLHFERSLAPKWLRETRTTLWPGPGTLPYILQHFDKQATGGAFSEVPESFKSYSDAASLGMTGKALFREIPNLARDTNTHMEFHPHPIAAPGPLGGGNQNFLPQSVYRFAIDKKGRLTVPKRSFTTEQLEHLRKTERALLEFAVTPISDPAAAEDDVDYLVKNVKVLSPNEQTLAEEEMLTWKSMEERFAQRLDEEDETSISGGAESYRKKMEEERQRSFSRYLPLAASTDLLNAIGQKGASTQQRGDQFDKQMQEAAGDYRKDIEKQHGVNWQKYIPFFGDH